MQGLGGFGGGGVGEEMSARHSSRDELVAALAPDGGEVILSAHQALDGPEDLRGAADFPAYISLVVF